MSCSILHGRPAMRRAYDFAAFGLSAARRAFPLVAATLVLAAGLLPARAASDSVAVSEDEKQVVLEPAACTSSTEGVTMDGFIDEQAVGQGASSPEAPETPWDLSKAPKSSFPAEIIIDLGEKRNLSQIMFYDLHGRGNLHVSAGEAGNWKPLFTEDGVGFRKWKAHPVEVTTRYLRLEKESAGGSFGELLVYELKPEAAARRAQAKEIMAAAKEEVASRPLVDAGPPFGKLPLIDEIDVAVDPAAWDFVEHPKGASEVREILGRPTRVISSQGDGPKFLAYRIAKNKIIEPGKAYLLTVDFPEDEARAFSIANRGSDMTRGVFTGHATGDSFFGYTATNLESLDVPLSGKHETFRQFFFLNDRFAGIEQQRGGGERAFDPIGGFYVILGQFEPKNMPRAQGVAVSRIRLFSIPDPEKLKQPLVFPPEGVPRRHVFYREEMADGVINSVDPNERTVDKVEDWYAYHAKLMNFLGMNTFSKDLLEFGRPQGWDVGKSGWFLTHKFPTLWGSIVDIATQHGLDVLPYYEYAGSSGPKGLGTDHKKHVLPLKAKEYTHIKWAEQFKADLTAPETLEDFKRILDITVVQFKDCGRFVGIWLRPRIAQLPISFADSTLQRFNEETGQSTPLTREELAEKPDQLEQYYAWWFGKRRAFLEAIQNYLQAKGVAPDPVVLYQTVYSEPAPTFRLPGAPKITLVSDNVGPWQELTANPVFENLLPFDLNTVLNEGLYRTALTTPPKTWGAFEWQHAAPKADPETYKDATGVLLTYPFNRLYTVQDTDAIELFRGKSGLAMIRHYPLNENNMGELTGYFVCDMDRSGAMSMWPEALAVAKGDPWFLGYLAGHVYNRGFPEHTRKFNANFLALPALPSTVIPAAADPEVVVRKIETPGHGTYLAVVNTGMKPKAEVEIKLPAAGNVSEPVTGARLVAQGGTVKLALDAAELRTLRIE